MSQRERERDIVQWGCLLNKKVIGPRLVCRLVKGGLCSSYKAMSWEMCHLFLNVWLPVIVLVVHKVMVGLDIFVRDIMSWGSCSQMEVLTNYKMDP